MNKACLAMRLAALHAAAAMRPATKRERRPRICDWRLGRAEETHNQ